MKAAYYFETGAPDVIQFGELPDPKPGDRDVLVRILRSSVNPIDTYIRNGANYWPLPKPFIPGCDFAGEIVQVGGSVRDLVVGQRVWGSNQGLLGRQGTASQLAAIDASWVYPLPDNVSFDQGAACALVGITAHLGLFREGQLKPDQWVFVRGGTGGVGSMVLQIAKAIGAKVATTAGSEAKASKCRELGADLVVEHQKEDLSKVLQSELPQGVHLFWETLREPNFDLAVACLAERGRMILMAGRDARPGFPVGPFYVKGCSLHGFAMFKSSSEEQRLAANDLSHWMGTGALQAPIDRVIPISNTAEAHRLQEQSTVQKTGALAGKIVLDTTR